MRNINRIAMMRHLLTAALAPTQLDIIDESHLHRGHAGAASGAGHFAIKISAPSFAGKTPIQAHRAIYAALDGMMGSEIHALSIKVA